MLRLLPSICRDCGASSEASTLSRYLDFLLCSKCIGLREKALRESGARRPASHQAEQEAAGIEEVQAPVAPGKKKRLPGTLAPSKKAASKAAAAPAKKPARKSSAAKKPKPPSPKR